MPKTDTRSVFTVVSLSMATPSCIAWRKLASQKIIKRPRNIYLHILASIATVDGTIQVNAARSGSFIYTRTSAHLTSLHLIQQPRGSQDLWKYEAYCYEKFSLGRPPSPVSQTHSGQSAVYTLATFIGGEPRCVRRDIVR